ncbi:MAG: phosphotransferase [Bdellovibrionales bacterium]|nr:phosphotransferase [Bdellovibrionales bacterium]
MNQPADLSLKHLQGLFNIAFTELVHLHTGENESFLLSTANQQFVLKVYRKKRSQRVKVDEEIKLLNWLGHSGIKTVSESVIKHSHDRIMILQKFISGYMLTAPEPRDYQHLGQEIRLLHQLKPEGRDLPQLDFASVIAANWPDIENASFLSDKLILKLNSYKELVQKKFVFSGTALIHFDLHWGNILIDSSNSMVLLDWEECGVGNPILDLATVNTHLMKKASRSELLKGLLEGYQGQFTNEEMNLATMVKLLNLLGHIPSKLDMPQLKDPAAIFERYLGYFQILTDEGL